MHPLEMEGKALQNEKLRREVEADAALAEQEPTPEQANSIEAVRELVKDYDAMSTGTFNIPKNEEGAKRKQQTYLKSHHRSVLADYNCFVLREADMEMGVLDGEDELSSRCAEYSDAVAAYEGPVMSHEDPLAVGMGVGGVPVGRMVPPPPAAPQQQQQPAPPPPAPPPVLPRGGIDLGATNDILTAAGL